VPDVVGAPVTVGITIPDGMPQSMFPLVFTLEPDDPTLATDTSKGIDMPVSSGRFTRTLSWSDYSALAASGGSRTFFCYFLTTRTDSATTIRVSNEYFNPVSVSFINALVGRGDIDLGGNLNNGGEL
jgi:hypothetical protein